MFFLSGRVCIHSYKEFSPQFKMVFFNSTAICGCNYGILWLLQCLCPESKSECCHSCNDKQLFTHWKWNRKICKYILPCTCFLLHLLYIWHNFKKGHLKMYIHVECLFSETRLSMELRSTRTCSEFFLLWLHCDSDSWRVVGYSYWRKEIVRDWCRCECTSNTFDTSSCFCKPVPAGSGPSGWGFVWGMLEMS